MIRLFNVYYPTRTIVLLLCEALIVGGCFLVATMILTGPDTYLVLNYEYGWLKIVCLIVLALLFSYYFDLYEPQRISERWEIYFRLLLVLGFLSFFLSGVIYMFPGADIANSVLLLGLIFLTIALVAWRSAYQWIIGRDAFRERVYVLGAGERAQMVVDILRNRKDAGMEIVGFGSFEHDMSERPDAFQAAVADLDGSRHHVDRVIVALEDRRGSLPLRELLKLRFNGVVIEEAGTLLERLTGKLYLDGLRPSNFIYSEGFRVKPSQQIARRLVSTLTALAGLLIFLPFLPFVILAVRLSSPGPIFFRQTRVGQGAATLPSTNSAPCARTPRPPGPSGRPRTILASPASGCSCARPGWTRYRSYGTFCEAIWASLALARSARSLFPGSPSRSPTSISAT